MIIPFSNDQLRPKYYFLTLPDNIQKYITSCSYVWEVMARHDQLLNSVTKQEISKKSNIDRTVSTVGSVRIEEGVCIQSHVRIEGPTIIGKDTQVSQGTYIRANTYIGNNCVIGHGSEIKDSVLLPYAKVSSLCFIGNSFIFSHGRVGGGAVLANRRFDQQEIIIKFKDNIFKTGQGHFGSVIGEGSRIGANVVLSPGTFVGKNTFITGPINMNGFIPSNTFIEPKQDLRYVENRFKADLKP